MDERFAAWSDHKQPWTAELLVSSRALKVADSPLVSVATLASERHFDRNLHLELLAVCF